MRSTAPLAAVLAALVLLAAGCGGETTKAAAPETVVGTIQQETLPQGDPKQGVAIFKQQGCASCHTLEQADAHGNVGPNLNEALKGADEEFIRTSIVNPNAEVAKGYQPGIMPSFDQLPEQQLADLVALLREQT